MLCGKILHGMEPTQAGPLDDLHPAPIPPDDPATTCPKHPTTNSDAPPPRLSMGVETYLLSIYQLQEEDIRVTTTQRADRLRQLPEGEVLGATLPSVGAMLRRTVRDGRGNTVRKEPPEGDCDRAAREGEPAAASSPDGSASAARARASNGSRSA